MVEQRGPRLGTEHDQSPCKPEQHDVSQNHHLLEVIFKRRSTSQQVRRPPSSFLALARPCLLMHAWLGDDVMYACLDGRLSAVV
jgi:hypothetical protein